jgi:hypothetical protein
VICLDSGLWAIGYAGGEAGRLAACGASIQPKVFWTQAAKGHALTIAAACPGDHAIKAEKMQIRPSDGLARCQDLLDLQAMTCTVAGLLDSDLCGVELVPVSSWKSNVRKDIHHKRLIEALRPDEARIVSEALTRTRTENHKEILDAVGIFLYKSGRTRKDGTRV